MLSQISQSLLATLFVTAPTSVVPLLNQSTRLDLIDLYEAGMTAQGGNRYGGISEMTMLNDTLLTVRLTDVSTLQMRLVSDSIVEVTHSVKAAERDFTTTACYTKDWQEVTAETESRKVPR